MDWISTKELKELKELKTQQQAEVWEWGVPHGQDARLAVLSELFRKLGGISSKKLLLWIYPEKDFSQCYQNEAFIPYPLALAKEVPLEQIFFITSDHPVKELRPVFNDKTFSAIVIDSPPVFSNADFSFLNNRARQFGQYYFVLRPFFLSANQGNVFCRHRINIYNYSAPSYPSPSLSPSSHHNAEQKKQCFHFLKGPLAGRKTWEKM